jgi:hypothetical protein
VRILGTVGKTITDIHADNTTRYKNEGDAGNQLAGTIANSSDRAAATRAEVQKAQGSWGPFGLAGFIIAMMFAYHLDDRAGFHAVASRLHDRPLQSSRG